MEDEKGPDEKIICVPLRDPRWSEAQTVDDIGFAFKEELEHFFQVYKDLEAGKVETGGFTGVDAAWQFIREARERAAAAY
jgi:inorganic pyrophosphatase